MLSYAFPHFMSLLVGSPVESETAEFSVFILRWLLRVVKVLWRQSLAPAFGPNERLLQVLCILSLYGTLWL